MMTFKSIFSVVVCLILSFVMTAEAAKVSSVTDIVSLKAKINQKANDVAIVEGYHVKGDEGGGIFRWDTTISSGENNGTIVKSDKYNDGRWVRVINDDSSLNARWFGAKGDAVANDKTAIQTAIDTAKSGKRPLYFPKGIYRCTSSLDFTDWEGIELKGDGPSASSIAGGEAITEIVFASVEMVGADFSGSRYGKITGISFTSDGTKPKATVLLARTSSGDGGSLTFENCNFQNGTEAGVYVHSLEPLIFQNCRFHAGGVPGLLLTGMTDYGVSSPYQTLATEVKVGNCSIFGGEFTNDNTSSILLDGRTHGLSGFSAYGTYFPISGNNAYTFKTLGDCENLGFYGHRSEVTNNGSDIGFGWIEGNVSGLFIKANVTQGLTLAGPGNLIASFIYGGVGIDIGGDVLSSEIVCYHLGQSISIGGDAKGSRFVFNGTEAITVGGESLYTIIASGIGEVNNIVHRVGLYGSGSSTYAIDQDGWFYAAYAGDAYLIYSSMAGGTRKTSTIKFHDQSALGNPGTGSLSLPNESTIRADYSGTGDYFVVRKF